MKRDINIDHLKQGPIRPPLLPEALVARIKAFKEILAEVDIDSLAETIESFQEEVTRPEREIVVWERIAFIYQHFLAEHSSADLATKKEVFSVLMRATITGLGDWSDIKHLTRDEIRHLVAAYKGL